MTPGIPASDSSQHVLILLSGLGADERMFIPQLATFPNLIVPKWLEPRSKETMADYALRFAERVNSHTCGAVLKWREPQAHAVPIYHIRGAKDRIFSSRKTEADEILPAGGHLISLTHGSAVNRFLRAKMNDQGG